MELIPLELQPTLNASRRKAREPYLIHRGQVGKGRGNDKGRGTDITEYVIRKE